MVEGIYRTAVDLDGLKIQYINMCKNQMNQNRKRNIEFLIKIEYYKHSLKYITIKNIINSQHTIQQSNKSTSKNQYQNHTQNIIKNQIIQIKKPKQNQNRVCITSALR